MRNRFTRGLCVLAASAAVTTTLGLSAAGAASAATHQAKPHGKSNATLVCGFLCFNLSNLQLDGTGTGAFIQNAKGGATGTTINLRAEGIAKPNEDFTAAINTTVGTLAEATTACGNGELSPTSIFCLNPLIFSGDPVFEANFAPDSNETGLCVGNKTANVAGRVALEPCGVSPTTMWVFDTAQFPVFHHGHLYAAWLNGGDTNFSHPLALTVNPSSHHPVNVLRTDEENTTAAFLPDTQLFTESFGHAGT